MKAYALVMKTRTCFFLLVCILTTSCEKEEKDTMTVEGFVLDQITKEPVAGVAIEVDAIKPPTGMGIITDGKRKRAATAITDINGFYHCKLKLFEEAERCEFKLNVNQVKNYATERTKDFYLKDLSRGTVNTLDFELIPITLLKISFNNDRPISDNDFFYFNFYSETSIGGKIVESQTCGSVIETEAGTWRGKDVCGTTTVETEADRYTYIYWTVEKNNLRNSYRDSTYCERGKVSEFIIKY